MGHSSASAGNAELKPFAWDEPAQRNAWIALAACTVGLVWAYWLMLTDAAAEWDQPQYSHGWVLPLLSLYMLWRLRPNKSIDAKGELALKASAGVGIALIAAGLSIESLSFLQGIGLTAACVGGFLAITWDQPFATMNKDGSRLTHPEALWGVLVGGVVLSALGIVGVVLGPLRPEMLGFLGLFVMMLGVILNAVLTRPTTMISWHEIAVGALVVLAASAVWMSGVYYDRMPLARASFVTTGVACLMMIGGLRLVRWAGAPVAFLMFMFPLPSLFEQTVLGLLQKVAVEISEMVYTLMGIVAIREGNTIRLPGLGEDIQMEIAQGCSGLSMTNILVAMVVAMVILMERPWWDRLILLLSALPIAIVSNVFRIVLTGLIWMLVDYLYPNDPEFTAKLRDPLHTWIGLIVMMPFALGLMLLELKVLAMLSVPEDDTTAKTQVLGRGAGAPIR